MKGPVLMFLLVVEVLCFAPSTLAWPKEADECGTLVLHGDPPKLILDLAGITSRDYSDFLAQLRERLGTTDVLGFRVLRSSVELSERFVLVDITNYAEQTTTLALDVINLYVVGYAVGNVSVFIELDDDAMKNVIAGLFKGTERHDLPFTGGYNALQQAAGVNRDAVPLGTGALDSSVRSMDLYARSLSPLNLHSVARALIVCIQMVSEAARFPYIEHEMGRRIQTGEDSAPDGSVIGIETTWDTLSEAIQTSSRGVFLRPVDLQRRNYSWFQVFNVKDIVPIIGILLFKCIRAPEELHPVPAAVIRLVRSEAEAEPEPECPAHVEPKVRIVGADGLCVDVRDGHYNNGNPVQLWPCKSNDDENQLWTFRSDGTLRSNGKCLASYGETPRDYIMIYDCEPGVHKFTWHSWTNGTISSASGLVLSTDSWPDRGISSASDLQGLTLAAGESARTTGQSWLPTNETQPPVYQIAGLSGLCLHADGDGVVLRGCASMEEGSFWALYPDSSIRPRQRRHTCLAPRDGRAGVPLITVSCNPNYSFQRWLFGNDGTITNLNTDLVMDVTGSAAPGAHLTLNGFAGTDTQVWQALL